MTDLNLGASAKLQMLGRAFVLQLASVLRTMRLHEPNNRALLVASENLKETINTLWAALEGSVQLQFVDGVVFLNNMRLRLEGGVSQQVVTLEEQFASRGMGGLAFSRPVDGQALKSFLQIVTDSGESEEDLEERTQDVGDRLSELEQEREVAASMLPDRALEVFNHSADLNDGETMAEVREVNRRHREYVCGECNVELPFNTVVLLTNNSEELVQCVGCQRIMYIAEELKTALSK